MQSVLAKLRSHKTTISVSARCRHLPRGAIRANEVARRSTHLLDHIERLIDQRRQHTVCNFTCVVFVVEAAELRAAVFDPNPPLTHPVGQREVAFAQGSGSSH